MAQIIRPISAEIITTGTEILLGEIVDTNAAWIARRLRDAGINLYYKTTVGDNEVRVRSVLELGLSRSDVLIVTGGLGPTVDDITRQAISLATGRELKLNSGALVTLQERFARFGVEMTVNNRQQAMIPEGAEIIPNPVGTAPGFIVDTGDGTIVALPGVPREMKRLMIDTVLPYLGQMSGHQGVIRRRILRTIGIGESTLDDRLGTLMRGSNPTVGLAAKTAQADIRITARAATEDAAEMMIDELAEIVYGLVGNYVYSELPDETIEAVVVRLLASGSHSLALLESNTGGRLAERIHADAQGKDVLIHALSTGKTPLPPTGAKSIVAVTAETKAKDIGVIANALRTATDATYGLAILGTSDPRGGIYGTDSGVTWIALVGDGLEDVSALQYGGTDDFTVTRIGNQALGILWQTLRQTQ